MKIGWATPLHHASTVTRFSVRAAEALAERGFNVDLLRTERGDVLPGARVSSRLKVHQLAGRKDGARLCDYDLLVYNIGDDASLYYHALHSLQLLPGIFIFHDIALPTLGGERAVAKAKDLPIGNQLRSAQTVTAAQHPISSSPELDDGGPLNWLAPFGLAAVVHDRGHLARLKDCCSGPIRYIPLASDVPEALGSTRHPNGDDLRRKPFSFDDYAEAFVTVIEKTFAVEPLMRLGLQLGRELSSLGANAGGPEASHIECIATHLFCPPRRWLSERLEDSAASIGFRFLPAIHAAMMQDIPVRPLVRRSKKRRGIRRNIGRPFEQFCRYLKKVALQVSGTAGRARGSARTVRISRKWFTP